MVGCRRWALVISILMLGAVGPSAPAEAEDDPARVLVLYNTNFADENGNGIGDSTELALHYQARRGVPAANMLGLACSTGTGYSQAQWSTFFTEVVNLVRHRLDTLGPESILFMVACYGMPITIEVGGTHSSRSLDNALMNPYLLGTASTPSFPDYWYGNPYLESSPSIGSDVAHFHHGYKYAGQNIYPVTRLEGDTIEYAKELVDRALYGELYIDPGPGFYTGMGYVDSRYGQYSDPELAGYPFGYNTYASADKCMAYGKYFVEDAGFTLKWEPFETEIGQAGATFHDSTSAESAPDALWYGGWYNYNTYHDAFEWMVGAVACDLNSDSGVGVRSPDTNWRFLAQALARGLTAGPGVTGEPYLNGHPRPEVLLYFLYQGYNYAESFFACNPALSWRVIAYGDPLYNPLRAKTPMVDDVLPPVPVTWDWPPAGSGDSARILESSIDTTGREPDLVLARVDYGETESYGLEIAYGTVFRMRHSISLTGLAVDTDYHYRVTVRDPAGNESAGPDQLFHTQANASVTPTITPTATPSPTWTPSPTATPSPPPSATPTPLPPPLPAATPPGILLLLAALGGLIARRLPGRR